MLVDYPQIELLGAIRAEPGLMIARRRSPHLILLDLHLPDMNGQDVLRCLKSDDATSSIPVVVLSADATPARRKELIELGAQSYLTKPLNIRDFIQLIVALKNGEAN